MLTEAALRGDIARTWEYVESLNIGQAFATPVSLTASDTFKSMSRDIDSSYEEVYLAGLKNVDYNILNTDFSYFQFSRETDHEFRFAYYPNPFLGVVDGRVSELADLQEYVREGIVDTEDYLRQISEIRVSRFPPMLRYEFSDDQYDEGWHPASHFHIGMYSDWRWGSAIALTGRFFALTWMPRRTHGFRRDGSVIGVGGVRRGPDRSVFC